MKPILSVGYSIYVSQDALHQLQLFLKKNNFSQYVILCDENTLTHCLPILLHEVDVLTNAEIIEIESGEQSKSIDIATHIWHSLIDLKADKNTLLINLGGGVVSDLGGFAASVYKRGIDFINIPTSLLAMADASVGGKTGIDFADIKNSIGTITQPKAVFVHFDFLETLSNQHLKNGLAEVYKMALILDAVFWKKITSPQVKIGLNQIIIKSIQLKNRIVKKDPFEKNHRKALNFGHTVGHAIESVSLNTLQPLLHGEAIVIGMITESWISYHKKLITKQELNEVFSLLIKLFKPKPIQNKHIESIIKLAQQDKKNQYGKIKATLLNGIGAYTLDVEITSKQLQDSIAYFNKQIL